MAPHWAHLLQPPPASCWPRQGSRSAQLLALAMETQTQQLTPLLAWPLVASGRSKGPSMGPRGLWLCLGEDWLAGSTSMGAAQSWAGASASPSMSGECLASVRLHLSNKKAAVQGWATLSTLQHNSGRLKTSGQWTAGQHAAAATGRLVLLHGCETVSWRSGMQCMLLRSTEPQPVASSGTWRPGWSAHAWLTGAQIGVLTRLANCLSCAH